MSGGHIRNRGRHFLEEELNRHVENPTQIEKSVRPDPVCSIRTLGAAITLNVLPPLFAMTSIPISVLEVVPGIRSRNIEALSACGLAIACAAILRSQEFMLRRMSG